MAKYRRSKDKDTGVKWHWCTNCSRWPESNYEEITTFNIIPGLCRECREKDSVGDCKK